MTKDSTHRGIFYVVRPISEQRWEWEIAPPDCIKGLRAESGEINGHASDAILAAKRAIELQTIEFMQ